MNAQRDVPVGHDTERALQRENEQLRGDLLTISRRVSHDLRTPLGAIINTLEALREILAETDPNMAPLVASALGSADDLSLLIKRVSFLLRATSRPSVPGPVPMGTAVSAAVQRLERKSIRLGANISQIGDWPEVNGVEAWLEEVWWNLLANALEHGGPSPSIELGWQKLGGKLQFWVADNGPGVQLEKRAWLFQSFDRLYEADSARGLGLPIVLRLVELQGGECGYEENAGGGARFYFVLPGSF